MSYKLVIVESPAKAKTIQKYLPKGCKVKASMGHVIDLPKSKLGVDVENNFAPEYKTIHGKGKILKEIKDSAKKAEEVILATDPDREGEAISFHIANYLGLDLKESNRIEFHEITPNAIKKAIDNKRTINMDLVDAQQARRVLDRLVGYKISPVLWSKIMRGLSAGRVQSVATRIIINREEEIKNFISEEYWTIDSIFSKLDTKESFKSKLLSIGGKKTEIKSEADVKQILGDLEKDKYLVNDVKIGSKKKNPFLPFTTSTLQQDAYKKLGFSTKKTMMIAQQLYEGVEIKNKGQIGLITYIRTDSTRISEDAKKEAIKYIEDNYGKEYLGSGFVRSKKKSNVQDAHEAIRATDVMLSPEVIGADLSKDQLRLYTLIYNRYLSSLMASAVYDTLRVDVKNGDYIFRSTGSKIKFSGFLKVYYVEPTEDELSNEIPHLEVGNEVILDTITPSQKFTQPPPRYTEASLVKALEEDGIGRPSTYAPTISVIINRGYVEMQEKKFHPTDLGYAVNKLLIEHFKDIVDIEFTAGMEKHFDEIAEGNVLWNDVIKEFYKGLDGYLEKAGEIERIKLPEQVTDVICENCGKNMVIKMGRFGKFLACPGYPECKTTKAIVKEINATCPKCGEGIIERKSKKGRIFFGCKGYPECDFVSWNKPTKEKCPDCGKVLFEKGSGSKKTIFCEDKECGYKKK